jgi:hypothetical protein
LRLGVSLSWVAFIPLGNLSSTGIYSIDGQTPISFDVPAGDDSPQSESF